MGLFGGTSRYEKPGPGIGKNDPKKKGFPLFFSILGRKFWEMIPLSLLTLLVSLPLVTVGLGNVGSAMIARNYIREKPTFLKDDFFAAIRRNWKQALPIGLINFLVTALLLFDIYYFYLGWNSLFGKIGLVISGCTFIVVTFMKYYINTLIVTFRLSFKQIYRNAFLLSSAGLKENLLITVSLLFLYALVFVAPAAVLIYFENGFLMVPSLLFAIFLLPGIRALIIQFWVFPVIQKHMIDPYYEEHPEEKEAMHLLNLDEGETSQEETVFSDANGESRARHEESDDRSRFVRPRRRSADDDDDDTI